MGQEGTGSPAMGRALSRTHFLDDQRRHRRSSAVSAVLVVLALVVSGIPLSVLISPVLVAVVAILVHLADLVVSVPPELTGGIDRALRVLPETWAARRADVDVPWRLLAALFVLPGMLGILVLWAIVRATFRRTGVGGVLRRMESRAPRPDDVAEQRLVNLVEEVAVAAAVPPPRVLVIDVPAVNAAAAGLRIEDAAVVVTRGFMERLPRDAQQAVIAHLMGSVGNGDLRVAAEIMAVLQTWGLISLAFEAPILPWSRASLTHVVRAAGDTLRGRAGPREREAALDRLLGGAGYEYDLGSGDRVFSFPTGNPLVLVFGYVPLLLTMGLAAIAAKAIIWLFTGLVAGPFVAFLWRARRRLADATAVQLTRDPDALASALKTASGAEMKVPGAVAVNFLFPYWDPAVDNDATRSDVASALLHMHLPLPARLQRLERLGAQVREAPAPVAAEPIGQTVRDLAMLLRALAAVVLLIAALLVANALVTAGVLYLLWWVLNAVFVALPLWIARKWG